MSDFTKHQSVTAPSWAKTAGSGAGLNDDNGFKSLYSGGETKGKSDTFVATFVSEEKARAIANTKKEPQDHPETLPPEEVEAVKKQAYDEAFAQGQAAGLEEGRKQAREIVGQMEAIAAHMETAWANLIETHEASIIELVARAVGKVVYGQAATDQDMVKRAIIEALRVVPEPVNVQISVSPKDYEFIETVKADFFSQIEALKDVSVTPDPSIHQGGCNVRTRFGEVDATIETRLEAIRECLLKPCGKKAEPE